MSHIKQLDHVGITVADLDTAAAFFVDLGLKVERQTFLKPQSSTRHRRPGRRASKT